MEEQMEPWDTLTHIILLLPVILSYCSLVIYTVNKLLHQLLMINQIILFCCAHQLL